MEKLTFSQFNQEACQLHKEEDGLYHRLARHFGLADSALWILYVLEASHGPVTQAELCGYLSLSKQTVNSALRKLEAEHILYLEMSGGKNKTVHLTEDGKILAGKTAGRVLAAEDEILASWPQEDVQKYLELTEAYMLALKEKAKHIETV